MMVAATLLACSKPPPPLVVALHADPPDGSDVHHTIIALHSIDRKLILNMEVLTPAEFVDYRCTLLRGTEKVASEDHVKMENEAVRMDLETSQVPPGEYKMVLEARDEKGKIYPFSTFNFRTI